MSATSVMRCCCLIECLLSFPLLPVPLVCLLQRLAVWACQRSAPPGPAAYMGAGLVCKLVGCPPAADAAAPAGAMFAAQPARSAAGHVAAAALPPALHSVQPLSLARQMMPPAPLLQPLWRPAKQHPPPATAASPAQPLLRLCLLAGCLAALVLDCWLAAGACSQLVAPKAPAALLPQLGNRAAARQKPEATNNDERSLHPKEMCRGWIAKCGHLAHLEYRLLGAPLEGKIVARY